MNNNEQIKAWANWRATHSTKTYTYRNRDGEIVAVLTPRGKTITNFKTVMQTILEAAAGQMVTYTISDTIESRINIDSPNWPPKPTNDPAA